MEAAKRSGLTFNQFNKITNMIYLIVPALIPLLAAGISGASGIASSLIQRGQSRRDIQDQNKYNRPSEQLARLREAGLPFAAYANNQAGNQSGVPIATDGGLEKAGNTIANYVSTQAQLKQLEILKADARIRNAEADIKEDEAVWKTGESPYSPSHPGGAFGTQSGGRFPSNQQVMLEMERDYKNAERLMKQDEQDLYAWESMAKKKWAETGKIGDELEARLQQILAQNRIFNQTFQNVELQRKAINTIVQKLEKGGMSFFEAVLFALTTGGMTIPRF